MNSDSQRKIERIKNIYTILGGDIKNLTYLQNKYTGLHINVPNEFIIGLIDGDGCFSLGYHKNGKITVNVNIALSKDEMPLLKYVQQKFSGIGSIYFVGGKAIRWMVLGINEIVEKIIPFVDSQTLHTEKAYHYLKFKEICLILYKQKSSNLTLSQQLENKVNIIEKAYTVYE